MRVFIGLDGGGTGSRAQAQLQDGRRTAVVEGGPANVFSNSDGALREVALVLARCLAQARHVAPEAELQDPEIVLGLAGASECGGGERVRAGLPYGKVTVLGDVEIALGGAFLGQDGIVMAVGTGSVLARQRAGGIQRIGGYGLTLGDEGSGAWIGREALRRCLQAEDGLIMGGTLTQALWARFGSVVAITGFVSNARPADFAALAPLVLEHDCACCPVAGAILDEGCGYFRRAIARLQEGDTMIPVAATGGLGPVLLRRLMRQGHAHLRQVAPAGTSLDGALWLARGGNV